MELEIHSRYKSNKIDWSVVRHLVQHAPLRLAVEGAGLSGYVDTFVRPSPVMQPKISKISQYVDLNSSKNQVALVIGGSRGLGELTAKIIAAGGGQIVISYLLGDTEAEKIVEEINNWGGKAICMRLDINDPKKAIYGLKEKGIVPTQVYYFASPRIASNISRELDKDLLDLFISYYVEGFSATVEGLKEFFDNSSINIFYPSTVFIDSMPEQFKEYTSSKELGEVRCSELINKYLNFRILINRLPRMTTDQTVGFINLPTEDSLPVMINVVKNMHTLRKNIGYAS